MSFASMSINRFAKIPHRVLPAVQNTTLTASDVGVVVSWNANSVHFWRLAATVHAEPTQTNLGSLTFNFEGNLACCAITSTASHLLVSTISESRIYAIAYVENDDQLGISFTRMAVTLPGASHCSVSATHVVLASHQAIFVYPFADNTVQDSRSQVIPISSSVSRICQHGALLAIAYANNEMDTFSFANDSFTKTLVINNASYPRLSRPITSLMFLQNGKTLCVATVRHRLYLFDTSTGKALPWTQRNSHKIPQDLRALRDCALGMFCIPGDNERRIWQWGANWVSWVRIDMDLPNASQPDDDDDDEDPFTNFFAESWYDRKQDPTKGIKRKYYTSTGVHYEQAAGEGLSWWVTQDWQPLLTVAPLTPSPKDPNMSMVVIERPLAAMIA